VLSLLYSAVSVFLCVESLLYIHCIRPVGVSDLSVRQKGTGNVFYSTFTNDFFYFCHVFLFLFNVF